MIPPSPLPPFTPVTHEDLAGLPPGISEPGVIMVYLPMSYQIGGYAALVPCASVQPVDTLFEEAMRFALNADLGVPAVKGA
jgi:hypothetical protein